MEKGITITFNQLLWSLIPIIIISTIILYLFYRFTTIRNVLKKTVKVIYSNIWIFLSIFPAFYLLYYSLIFDIKKPDSHILSSIINIEYLKNLSIAFFSAGILSGVHKYISSIQFFKNEFEKIILSKSFDEVLTKKMSILTFDPEYLSKLNDIDDKWKKLTLCKYQQKFPDLMKNIEPIIKNELFKENNLSYYYDDFRIKLHFELLENNIVKITETNFLTVIPTSKEKIDLNFWVSHDALIEETENIYTRLNTLKTTIDGINLDDYFKENSIEPENKINGDKKEKHYKIPLLNQKKYEVERVIEMTQDLDNDRLCSFSSSKMVNGISLRISLCEKLNYFFSCPNNITLKKDRLHTSENNYLSKEWILPGNIYNIFIYKRDNN